MRRIIERIVTVVTTTTWKISWEADPPQAAREVGFEPHQLPDPEISENTSATTVLEAKEVELSDIQDSTELPGD